MTDNVAVLRLLYVLPNFLAGLGMTVVAIMAWQRRRHYGGWALWLSVVGAAIWAFGAGMDYVGFSYGTIQSIWRIIHVGVAVTPLALVVFVFQYYGYGHWLTWRRITLFSILPALELLSAWTNDWHGLTWSAIWTSQDAPFPVLFVKPGPVLWAYSVYAYLLVLGTIGLLLYRRNEFPNRQRRQLYLVLIAMILPLAGAMAFMLDLVPVLYNMDLTPLAFNVSCMLLMHCFMREQLFGVVPVSAHQIYRSLEDAVFVLDDDGTIQDANTAASHVLHKPVDDLVGRKLDDLLSVAERSLCGEVQRDGRYFDVRMTQLVNKGQHFSGKMLVWRDISERKRMEVELQRLAVTDPLTGLYNRRYFYEHGEKEIKLAQRYQRSLSVIMLDIDHFKEVNDSFGHDAGDRVLTTLAVLLNSILRATDCIGRLGGEEFGLVLPDTDEAAAQELGWRLLRTAQAMQVALADGRIIAITLSAGTATLQPMEMSFWALMRRADKALYLAKNTGRSRLVQGVMPLAATATAEASDDAE